MATTNDMWRHWMTCLENEWGVTVSAYTTTKRSQIMIHIHMNQKQTVSAYKNTQAYHIIYLRTHTHRNLTLQTQIALWSGHKGGKGWWWWWEDMLQPQKCQFHNGQLAMHLINPHWWLFCAHNSICMIILCTFYMQLAHISLYILWLRVIHHLEVSLQWTWKPCDTCMCTLHKFTRENFARRITTPHWEATLSSSDHHSQQPAKQPTKPKQTKTLPTMVGHTHICPHTHTRPRIHSNNTCKSFLSGRRHEP